jgi:flavin reductase (DIM6/NTAB) family NADH-FMN oxidoreductase RutF
MSVPLVASEPATLCFGAPVVLISTLNEDGTPNLASVSSAFWLGWRCIFGLRNSSKTPHNMARTGDCVLNLPSVNEAGAVDRLAMLAGVQDVSEGMTFQAAGVTPIGSLSVAPPRVLECPIQLEAVLSSKFDVMQDEPKLSGCCSVYEVRITRVHFHRTILVDGDNNRVDPGKWRPLVMNLHRYCGLSSAEVSRSRQSELSEMQLAAPDIKRARENSFAQFAEVVFGRHPNRRWRGTKGAE